MVHIYAFAFCLVFGTFFVVGSKKLTCLNVKLLNSWTEDIQKRVSTQHLTGIRLFVAEAQIGTMTQQARRWKKAGRASLILMGFGLMSVGIFLYTHPNGW